MSMRNTIERLGKRRALATAGLALTGAAALTACGSMTQTGNVAASKAPTTALAPVTPGTPEASSNPVSPPSVCNPEKATPGAHLEVNDAVIVFAGLAKMPVEQNGKIVTEVVARPVVAYEDGNPVLTTLEVKDGNYKDGYQVGSVSTPLTPNNPNLTVYTNSGVEHQLDGCDPTVSWYPFPDQTQLITLTGEVQETTVTAAGQIVPIETFAGFGDGDLQVTSLDGVFPAGGVSIEGVSTDGFTPVSVG
jgi:hypothetical protein